MSAIGLLADQVEDWRGDAISNSGRKHCSSDGALNAGTPSPSPAALNAAALDYAGHDKGVHRLVTASNHSITSSARKRVAVGDVRPSAFAVLRLMTSWNFVDCITGKSPGFSPLRILPAQTPAWR